VKLVDPKEVLGIQAESVEYLAKDMVKNISNNQIDKNVMEVQAETIEYLAEDMEKNTSNPVLKVQEGTVEYLAKDMVKNISNNQIDKNVMEVQAGTIEYLAEDMEKNIKQLSSLKANQFINDFKDNNELEDEKRVNLATDAIQPLLHETIEPKEGMIEKSDKDCLEYKLVDGKLYATVSLIEASNNSWIGFFKKSDPNNKYINYNWLVYLKENTFVVDAPCVNGEYEFRVFKDKSTIALSKEYLLDNQDSFSLAVQDSTLVVNYQIFSFNAPQNSAWISIHTPEEENANKYRRFAYLKSNSGSVSFEGFITAGKYQARIYTQSYFTNTLKLTSNNVEINNPSTKN
jgi:hypothetical protein